MQERKTCPWSQSLWMIKSGLNPNLSASPSTYPWCFQKLRLKANYYVQVSIILGCGPFSGQSCWERVLDILLYRARECWYYVEFCCCWLLKKFFKVCIPAHLHNKLFVVIMRKKVKEVVNTSILKDKGYMKLHKVPLVFRFMLLYCHLLVLF